MSATFGCVGQIFVGKKIAAQDGCDPECGQEILRHCRTLQVNGVGLGQIAIIDASLEGEGGKRLLIIAPLVIEATERELLPCKGLHQPDRYQPIVVRVRQGCEKGSGPPR